MVQRSGRNDLRPRNSTRPRHVDGLRSKAPLPALRKQAARLPHPLPHRRKIKYGRHPPHSSRSPQALKERLANRANGKGASMKRKFIPATESFARWKKDPQFLAAYASLEEEFALASAAAPPAKSPPSPPV